VTKYAFLIAHQKRRSEVLPGYPSTSAGAYEYHALQISSTLPIALRTSSAAVCQTQYHT